MLKLYPGTKREKWLNIEETGCLVVVKTDKYEVLFLEADEDLPEDMELIKYYDFG